MTRELIEGQGFLYRKLGERLRRVIEQKEAGDAVAIQLLTELQALVEELNESKAEPERLGLTGPGEYPLFTVIREFAVVGDEALCVRAAKAMMGELRRKQCLPAGWADNLGGRKSVSLTLQVASWDQEFEALQLCPLDNPDPPFLVAAVDELARVLE